MNPITKQLSKKAAFTIIELLTVMTIIVILIAVLVPSLNMAKRFSRDVKQKAQFYSIDTALELFHNEWDDYPPSDATDEDDTDYCGAMKLCEAMVGQDLMGFHPRSRFRSDCKDGAGNDIYVTPTNGFDPITTAPENLKVRKEYLTLERIDAYRLNQLYGTGNTEPFDEDLYVLCDVYNSIKRKDTGEKVGMPILYYKADTSGIRHDPNTSYIPTATDRKGQIYNYLDNDELVNLNPNAGTGHGAPPPVQHPFLDPVVFYEFTKDKKITGTTGRPYRPDSYILISAGFDGLYGTDDDITNF